MLALQPLDWAASSHLAQLLKPIPRDAWYENAAELPHHPSDQSSKYNTPNPVPSFQHSLYCLHRSGVGAFHQMPVNVERHLAALCPSLRVIVSTSTPARISVEACV